jgi:hypothetical protein
MGEDGEHVVHSVVFPEGPTRVLLITDETITVNRILDFFQSSMAAAIEPSAGAVLTSLHVELV